MELKFRGLKGNEIEIRVERVTKSGAWLLLYKNARVDMAILDETVGAKNWKRGHEVINDNLFCNVSIWDERKEEWVTKQDVGVESYAAKEKGEASDSFKRACTCWGIGRELYTAPKIFIPCDTEPKVDGGKQFKLSKPYLFEDAYISRITYLEDGSSREIKELAISDKQGSVIWSNFGKSKRPIDPEKAIEETPNPFDPISSVHKTALEAWIKRVGLKPPVVCDKFEIADLSQMTYAQHADCCEQLVEYEKKKAKRRKGGKS